MSITYEENKVTFTSVTYEDEVVSFRDFLQEKAGETIKINLVECEDIHLAVLQLMMAYHKNYGCEYEYSDERKLFQTVLEGFDTSEDHCN